MGDERRWHLIDAREEDRTDVKAARWPSTVHHGLVDAAFFNGVVVPASVLEERDRDLAECNDNFDTVEQAAMAAQTEAESLRSQLTEARAGLQYAADLINDRYDDYETYRVFIEKFLGLVPAPQDREPTRPRSKLRWD